MPERRVIDISVDSDTGKQVGTSGRGLAPPIEFFRGDDLLINWLVFKDDKPRAIPGGADMVFISKDKVGSTGTTLMLSLNDKFDPNSTDDKSIGKVSNNADSNTTVLEELLGNAKTKQILFELIQRTEIAPDSFEEVTLAQFSVLVKNDLFRDSLDAPTTPVTEGFKKTRLDIIGTIPALTPLSVTDSGTGWIKSGQDGFLGATATVFNDSVGIRVERNGVNQIKGNNVIWATPTSLYFEQQLDVDEKIIIFS